jgi:nucleoside-diphosphate-sugar epimerase
LANKPTHILVTGANGFIGSHAISYFVKLGHKVTALSRTTPASQAQHEGINWLKADLSRTALRLPYDLDFIIHAAGRSPYHGGEEADLMRDNIEGTHRLAEAAIDVGCQKMIFLSGISVYGPVYSNCIDEETTTVPVEAYGHSKLAAEQLLNGSSDRLHSLILRLPGIVGSGAHSPWIVRCRTALKQGQTINAYNPKALFNNILHIDDLLIFIECCFHGKINKTDILTLASCDPVPIVDILENVLNATGKKGSVDFSVNNAVSFTISTRKACKEYGFNPMTTVETLHRYLKFHH